MPLYYPELKQPMAFSRMLPGCTGYVCPNGVIVHYGPRSMLAKVKEAMDNARNNWNVVAEVTRTTPKRKQPKREAPKIQPDAPASSPPKNVYKVHVCEACKEEKPTNRHHPIPAQIKRTFRTIRLCLECHGTIHTLPNKQLAEMPVADQIEYILNRRLIVPARTQQNL